MSILTLSRTYPQNPSEVFAALNDFAGVHRFHPLLESSPLVEGTPAGGAGSERVCNLYDGNTIHERLIDTEADKWLKVEIVDTSMPMARGDGLFELAPTASGGTEITLTMDFELTMGWFGKALDKLVMARKFRSNLDLLLAALGEYLATGEPIEKGWRAPAA